jgi:hypothetical protein
MGERARPSRQAGGGAGGTGTVLRGGEKNPRRENRPPPTSVILFDTASRDDPFPAFMLSGRESSGGGLPSRQAAFLTSTRVGEGVMRRSPGQRRR